MNPSPRPLLRLLALALGLLLAGGPPPARACGCRSPIRACFANQKTIAGAVEMYDLDFGQSLATLTPEVWTELHENGYLQSIPDDPGFGPGSHSHYVLVPGGNGVACLQHGMIQSPTPEARGNPREELRAAGVEDPRILEEAAVERAGARGAARGEPWILPALRDALLATTPFALPLYGVAAPLLIR